MSPSIPSRVRQGEAALEDLSPQARETLELIARPLGDNYDEAELAQRLGIKVAQLNRRRELLAAEMTNLAGGAELPKLSPVEYEALKESIREHGQMYPILVDGDGELVDGFHRRRACTELGLTPLEHSVGQLTAEQRQGLALVVNVARRQMPASARRGVAIAQLILDPRASDRSIAVAVGLSPSTIGALRRELEDLGTLSKVDSRVGRDRREQSVTARRSRPRPQPEPEPVLVTCPGCGLAFDPEEA